MKEIKIKDESYQILAKKSNRARRVRISINRKCQISLIIPKNQSYLFAESFLQSKIGWIEKTLLKIQNCSNQSPKKSPQKIYLTPDEVQTYSKNLIERCRFLAEKHNFLNIGKIKVRCQKTLWGSCSARNNISLNINLANLRQE